MLIAVSTAFGMLMAWPMAVLVDSVVSTTPSTSLVHRAFLAILPESRLGQIVGLALIGLLLKLGQDWLGIAQTIVSNHINYRNRYQVFYSLGVVAAKLGRSEEAKAAWEKSIALSPQYALPYLELAEYYLQRSDLTAARQYLEAFDRLSQPQPRSLWLAVQIEDGLGNRDAVASKGLALTKLFPNSQETRLYRAWVKDDQDN